MRIGQTLDGIAAYGGNFAVIASDDPDAGGNRIERLALHEAGSAGPSAGFNSAGVAAVYNSLVTPACASPPFGVPFRLRMARVLRAPTLAAAIGAAMAPPCPVAVHVLLAHRDGVALGLELLQCRAVPLNPHDGILTHANHIEAPGAVGIVESLFERLLPDSLFRAERMRMLLDGAGCPDDETIRAALADHFSYPSSICLHGDESMPAERRSVTLAGIVIDLGTGTLSVSDGQPCQTPFVRFTLPPR
jgi:isopenicillin-N N-acyltransferase-like protein